MHRFLLLIALLFSFAVHAQKIRFTDTTNKWFVLGSEWNGAGYNYGAYRCYYEGTVQQDSFTYNIYHAGHHDSALIREDTITGKIYAKVFYHNEYNDTTEFVLFDYNLQVGDTFITNNTERYLQQLDSVLINSVWHRVYRMGMIGLSSPHDPYIFIEGIGALPEPLFSGYSYTFEYVVNMICFENNSSNPLLSPAVEYFDNNISCADTVLSVKHLREVLGHIEIYPQPARQSVQMKFPKPIKNGSLKIIDYTGRTVYNKPIPESDEMTIYNEQGLYGIYFYTIIDNSGSVLYKGKIQFL